MKTNLLFPFLCFLLSGFGCRPVMDDPSTNEKTTGGFWECPGGVECPPQNGLCPLEQALTPAGACSKRCEDNEDCKTFKEQVCIQPVFENGDGLCGIFCETDKDCIMITNLDSSCQTLGEDLSVCGYELQEVKTDSTNAVD